MISPVMYYMSPSGEPCVLWDPQMVQWPTPYRFPPPVYPTVAWGIPRPTQPPPQPARAQPTVSMDSHYTPQTEAISPTLPSDMLKDESPLRSKKEDLLAMISKVDREIAQGESQIVKLKKKEAELEAAAKHGDEAEQDATKEADGISKHMAPLSLPQKIYLENREKAKEASACFSKFGSPVDMQPLYNQPSDCDIYHKNQRIRTEFRPRLVLWLRNKTILRVALQKKICQDYATALEAWLKKVERLENSARKKAKDAKMREYFEKIFPELRKQREDRERFSRVGARVKSEADMETVLQNIQEEEHEAKKMKELAVIPPVLWSAERKRNRFVNLNGVVEDPKKVFEEFHAVNIWNNQEKEIFKEKYLTHGKNFGLIASYLERKSVSDCVHFYYLSKKEVKYKELLKKINKRKNNKIGKVAPPPLPEILSTGPGVATRGSVAALRNQQHPQNQQDSNASKTKTEEPEGRSATEGTEASQKGPAGEEAVPSPGKKGAKENQGPPSSKENGVPSSRGRRGEREQRAAAKNAAATAETDSSEEDDETGECKLVSRVLECTLLANFTAKRRQ
ncbi:unnamed protein product [Cyprideis torosa]|uniref:Uncharacterized protein n=1 Tax=Cyprideis torosa TaxID=163714 RepID=A0A7R8WJN1_9CRUS|nr:unnamed protein product [Cyprideis torosa]CAG0895202.1 unnamed protein product [Cyprideis torosa]